MGIDGHSFSARVTYDASGRTFEMGPQGVSNIEISSCSWAPIGGLVVEIEANDGVRTVNTAFAIEQFVASFGDAIEKLCQLEIAYPEGETPQEKLEQRNQFLHEAVERYPSILMNLCRTLKTLTEKTEEASMRIATMRTAK